MVTVGPDAVVPSSLLPGGYRHSLVPGALRQEDLLPEELESGSAEHLALLAQGLPSMVETAWHLPGVTRYLHVTRE